MARCASLRPRAGDPLAIEMVGLEQELLEQRQQETMLLASPNRSTAVVKTNDPIDFFGAIRKLVETSIPPEEIEKYTPVRDHPLHPGAFDAYLGTAAREESAPASDSEDNVFAQKIVPEGDPDQDLRDENRFLQERLSELELALQQAQEHSHRLVRVERGPERGVCVLVYLPCLFTAGLYSMYAVCCLHLVILHAYLQFSLHQRKLLVGVVTSAHHCTHNNEGSPHAYTVG